MSKNVTSFLTKLDKLGEKTIEVFVPSLKKKIPTKPLNLKQQKDLISSMLDGIKGTLDFSKTLNKIIIENTGLTDLKTTSFVLKLIWDTFCSHINSTPLDTK